MFEDILDNIDWTVAGIALLMYAICLLLVWKFFDQDLMKLHLKIISSILMLPLCYGLTYFIINRD